MTDQNQQARDSRTGHLENCPVNDHYPKEACDCPKPQNKQSDLPPLDATPKWCPDCLTYHRCKPNEQLLQALRERDELRQKEELARRTCNENYAWAKRVERERDEANRRAEEAFNKGVEAAASYVEYAEADYLAGVVSHIRALKRPTQPEQTR